MMAACLMGAETIAFAAQTGNGMSCTGQTVYEMAAEADGNTMSLASTSMLSADQTELEKSILAAWDSHKTTCDISKYRIPTSSLDQIEDIYFHLLYKNPRYFYVGTSFRASYVGSIFQEIKISYTYTKAKANTMLRKFDTTVEQILSGMDAAWSDLEKALYLHDYICTNCSYDNTYTKINAYHALVENQAICEGYALAYEYLLSQVGIESEIVKSVSVNHAWNLVKLNGKYYHVDVTWDDPQNDRLGRARHMYFLKSTNSFLTDGKHYSKNDWTVFGSWTTKMAVSKTYDNSFWNNVDTAFSYFDGYWYAFNSSKQSICRYTCNGKKLKQQKKMVAVKDKWYVWGSKTQYLTKKFTAVMVYDGKLFYSTPTAVYRVNLTTGKSKKIYTLGSKKAKNGYIYGMFLTAKGKLQVQVAKTDTASGKIYSVKTIKATLATYQIKYSANGGTGKMTRLTCKTGTSYKLSGNQFVRAGYQFNGWNTKKNGTGKKYKDGAIVKNLKKKGTITLYAQWKKIS